MAALVDCDGTSVRANLINVEPDPEHVTLGMQVRLATEVIGADDKGPRPSGSASSPWRVRSATGREMEHHGIS